jgi:RimJ/RimL family protein N-acetyltransferase
MPTYPTLEPVPESIETERLLMRPYQPGDGAQVIEALLESRAELDPWFDWHQRFATVDDAEDLVLRRRADFIRRDDLTYALFDRQTGRFLGATGLHRPKWAERIFEIGYFLRTSATGAGYMTEGVRALTAMALGTLRANRVEIWCDASNHASQRVAERAGFALEGRLRNHEFTNTGALRDSLVYSVVPERPN